MRVCLLQSYSTDPLQERSFKMCFPTFLNNVEIADVLFLGSKILKNCSGSYVTLFKALFT